MTETQIITTLQGYFAGEGAGSLEPDSPLLSGGLLDSLGIVKLLSFLEDEFDAEISDADFDPDNFETIVTIAKLIQGQAEGA